MEFAAPILSSTNREQSVNTKLGGKVNDKIGFYLQLCMYMKTIHGIGKLFFFLHTSSVSCFCAVIHWFMT